MNERARQLSFLAAALVIGAGLLWASADLPAFGHYRGPYGDIINSEGISKTHATNMATAVNFDFRAFDTLGEEYILFAAVTGLALLLREARGEIEEEPREAADDRERRGPSDAVRGLGKILIGLTVVFGIYIIAHAQLTPGGGFQGGVILATACLLVYLTVGYREFHAVSPKPAIEFVEALGAGSYALIGLATLLASGVFLKNVLPLGSIGSPFSSGTIAVINAAVGLEVAGGIVLLFAEFLKETRKRSEEKSQ